MLPVRFDDLDYVGVSDPYFCRLHGRGIYSESNVVSTDILRQDAMISTNVVDSRVYGVNFFDVESLGQMVKRIRESRGWSQARLASEAKVGPHVIWGLETNRQREVKTKNIEPLASALGVPVEFVVNAINFSKADDDPEGTANNVREIGGTVPMRMLPVYRFVPANRMGGREDFYGEQAEQEPELIEAYAPSKNCIVIVLDGDCMEPKYKSGEKVIIDFVAVEQGQGLIPGACYFVQTRGEDGGKNTFKEYVGKENDEFVFRCLNPKYKTTMRIKPPFNAGLAVARM